MNLMEINLGEEGKEYLLSSCRGGRGLSGKIPRQLERGGDVFAPLPATTSLERATQFKAGGLTSWGGTVAWFERHVRQLSDRTPNGSLVFQDVWFKPQDRDKDGYDGAFFDQSGVYYILGPHEITAEAISWAVLELRSFLLVAAFCNFSFKATDVPQTRILDDTLIDEMANNAQEVFVSAYDREGLVVWRRTD